ncbi:methyltransferase [Vibrio sp. SCSIO 43136]|uniref:methyltransferase n=1 Tax=Vibrio sp. SCSIO 43136 TaxID=2819101 RepID=UPI002074BE17|nr:methyltransferase [Vibrio sp. SCSIO 43136]USD64383.1 methyltransferase [Vibrio sp. SCSIO 43136]
MQSQFIQIDQLLLEHQQLWRFEPFHISAEPNYLRSWSVKYPNLCQWLDSLSYAAVESLKSDSTSLTQQAVTAEPKLADLLNVIDPTATDANTVQLSSRESAGIPGRKLNQILAMGSACLAFSEQKSWLEWCSGKGFLGQVLARHSTSPVTSFEWQQALCDKGQQEADRAGLAMNFVQGDALDASASSCLKPEQHAVALHACGDLHVNLLKFASQKGTQALTVAPCCYHLIQADDYQALSANAQNSALKLSKAELRIPLQATVTGGERVRRHRRLEMSYRLGLSGYLESIYGEYIPIPSIKKSLLDDGFEAFCQWAAEKKSLNITDINFDDWLRYGQQRFELMEKLSLVQQLFQRPLEMWLILDRALFLVENGYQVSLSTFCDYKDTPRNLLIQAVKGK